MRTQHSMSGNSIAQCPGKSKYGPREFATKLAKRLLSTVFVVIFAFGVSATSYAQNSEAPLLDKADLVYLGAFKVPSGGSNSATFNYGGRSIAYNKANDSLFIVGHEQYQRTAEISIPDIINSNSLGALERAEFLQPFKDATEGKLGQINPGESEAQIIGGHLVYGDKLYMTGYSIYDASGTQKKSHFVRPLSLSTTGQVTGPVAVGSDVHLTSAYMTNVPPEWQGPLGGPVLTGNCCRSIIGFQSHGPAVSVFDPSHIGNVSPVEATNLVGYTSKNPLGPGGTTGNEFWNLKTRVNGVIFPVGTRSVLFFGEHGLGDYCYGESSDCGDPADGDKGSHTYPYKYQVWAYDANDLVDSKNGIKKRYEVLPYKIWNFDMPFVDSTDRHEIRGATYDPDQDRIFLVQPNGEAGKLPVIHVFEVSRAPRPAPPADLIAE